MEMNVRSVKNPAIRTKDLIFIVFCFFNDFRCRT